MPLEEYPLCIASLFRLDDGVPLSHNSPQPSASSVDRYFVWSTILTGLNRLRKMSLYSKGLLLIFLRPNFVPSLKISPALFGFSSSELRFEGKSSRGRNFRGVKTSVKPDVMCNITHPPKFYIVLVLTIVYD